MGFLLVIALYTGLFGLTLTSVGRQNNALIVTMMAAIMILLGIMRLLRRRDA